MSLPPEQNAFLASAIYNMPLTVGGTIKSDTREYTIRYVSPPSATNYRGAVVQDADTGQLIVTNKGTDFRNIHDTMTNVGMVAMGASTQWPEAAETMRQALAIARDKHISPSNISTTGHSLGGAHAQLQAAMFGVHAETFNAYGAATMARHLGLNVQAAQGLVVNHRMYHDPVSVMAEPVGRTVDYMDYPDYQRHQRGGVAMLSDPAAALGAHGIANFWDKEHNQPAAVFAHNYMQDLNHRALDDLPPGMPLDFSLPWPTFGQQRDSTLPSLPANASVDAMFDHLCKAMDTGDDQVFKRALTQVANTDFCQDQRAQAAERVDAQDRQAALENQLQKAQQQLMTQQISAPSMGISR